MSSQQATVLESAGVDVGFFATKYCWGRMKEDGQFCVSSFPSELADPDDVKDALRDVGFEVSVDGVEYFGGPGVMDFLKATGSREFREGWANDRSHKALFEIALASIANRFKTNRLKIEHLVGGLPMSTFHKDRQALQMVYGGTHTLPKAGHDRGDLVVTVENVRIVPQPAGSLFYFCNGALPRAKKETVLIADVGGGTFDWAVYERLRQQPARCGSAPIGTLAFARKICEEVRKGAGDEPKLLARVDEALNSATDKNEIPTVMIYGREVDLGPHLEKIHELQRKAVERMFGQLGKVGDVAYIIVSGGGGSTIVPALRAARQMEGWEGHLHTDKDSATTNVKGFLIIAEQMARGTL